MKIAPVTRAIRSALAASAAMLALAGTGPAMAGECTAPVDGTIHCNGDFADTINFSVEDLTLVVGDEAASTIAPLSGPGILADWAGSIGVTNSADITAYADGIDAIGSGDIDVENDGDIDVMSAGQVIGIYAYSDGGDVTVANSGDISAYSVSGLADGIFASGADVTVSNSGAIGADGYDWAAGIEAQGTGTTSVSNDGDISAYAYAAGGYAFGIYATGDDVTVANGGSVDAQGYYANGVYVQSGGNVSIDNGGSISAGGLYTSLYATGIHAASGGLDSTVSVTNSGDVVALGFAGATGIEALATGAGSSASATNTGNVYAGAYYPYGSGATGLVASADGDATVDNGGVVTVVSGGTAYGEMALAFNGNASATNSGDISVQSGAFLYYAASGITAFSQNGAASADNSGTVDVSTEYIGTGIDASGLTQVAAANSGGISVDAWRAYGIRAVSGGGDVSVENSGSIYATYSQPYYAGRAWGILATATAGDVAVENSGDISTSVVSQSVGIFGVSSYGNVTESNSGSIYASSYIGTAAGMFARSDYGDIAVSNAEGGSLEAYSAYGYAYGVLGSGAGVDVVNDGSIEASGFYAAAGINVYGTDSVDVSGSGSIQAIAYGIARGVNATSDTGAISVDNGGDVFAGSLLVDAVGVYAYSPGGDVVVSNSGYIAAVAPNGLADGIFAYGTNTDVTNAEGGTIVALGYSWAAGIEAQGVDSVAVTNAGDIAVQTYGVSEGFGIYAAGGQASVDNSGTVYVRGYDQSTGIYARGDAMASVTNSGAVYAGYFDNGYSSSYALALLAVSGGEGSEVAIDNSGYLRAISFSSSSGAEARALGTGGSASVVNSGDVAAFALSNGGSAAGLVAAADGDATVDNAGTLYAYSGGMAYGALAVAFNGEASVTNSGDITSINTAFPNYSAYGIVSSSQNGGAMADNSGSIYTYSPYIGVGMAVTGMTGAAVTNSGDIESNAWVSYGIRASSGQGDVSIDNSGSIYAHYTGYYSPYLAFGVRAETVAGDIAVDNSGDIASVASRQSIGIRVASTYGDIAVDSSGDIASVAYTQAFGIRAAGTSGDIAITNSGDIASAATVQSIGIYAGGIGDIAVDNGGSITSASSSGLSAGIFATDAGGDVSVANSGSLQAYSDTGAVTGAFARASQGTASITNSGDVGAATAGTAYGVLVRGYYAEAHNSGGIEATGGAAYGIYVDGTMYATVENSGDIAASTEDGVAFGVMAIGLYGAAVSNSGDISASAGENGLAVGVMAQSYYDVLVENSGTISATHPDVAIAVQLYSAAGTATLENSGTLVTDTSSAGSIAVLGSYGANVIQNTGDIYGAIVTFDADDQFANGQGGTWHVANGTTSFGGGDDAIENGAGGTIHLADGAIYLGASGSAGNSFQNDGTILTSDFGLIDMGTGPASLVPSLNPLPLVNDGIIDFVDGSPDDELVILGDLGGDGAINVDVSLLNGTGDLLYVDGSVVDGTTQAINLSIDGMPDTLVGEYAPVVAASGTIAAGSFVGGHVLNFDPSNFLDVGVKVGTESVGGANVVTAAVQVNGLNDTGVLAASVAQGAQSLVNSAIGTVDQRLGLQAPLADGQVGISPWLRFYTGKANMSPAASGFGSGNDYDFRQDNRGREFGFDIAMVNGFHIGLLGGSADGTQELTGASGVDRLKLHTTGLYGSWFGSRLYVDVSQRWMDFDARLDSASGEILTSGNATATNVEAGFTGWSAYGMAIVPQVQYTRTSIDNVDAMSGSLAQMEVDGGVSERGRVGVSLSHAFAGADGFMWTPYGGLSAVRELDGKTGFTIDDQFTGTTTTEGTSTLAELGIGLRRGGFSATAGVSWMDGGAVNNANSGQVVVRYTW
jgi:hypothetical protein